MPSVTVTTTEDIQKQDKAQLKLEISSQTLIKSEHKSVRKRECNVKENIHLFADLYHVDQLNQRHTC